MPSFNANFRNEATDKDYTVRADPGRQTVNNLLVLPPEQGLNSIECDEVVEDALTENTFRSLFRFMDDLVACQRYYSVLFSFRIDDAEDHPSATVYVRSTSFVPFARVWRNATNVFDVDPEQSSVGELVIPIIITEAITGPFIIEVTSEQPYQTGDFEVELVCEVPHTQSYYKCDSFTSIPAPPAVTTLNSVTGNQVTFGSSFPFNYVALTSGQTSNGFELLVQAQFPFAPSNGTLIFWYRTPPAAADFTFLNYSGNGIVFLKVMPDGSLRMYNANGAVSADCPEIINDGSWHRIVVIADGADYKVKVNNGAYSTIARNSTGPGNPAFVAGYVDEIHYVFEYVATDAEILNDWNGGAGRTWPAASI